MNVKIKLMRETSKLPTQGSVFSAGYDLYADIKEPAVIWAGDTVAIETGIAIEIPDGYYGALYARSGLATNEGLRPSTGTSVIDSDYRGEIMVALHNDSTERRIVQPGQRIAQLVIQKHESVNWQVTDTLSASKRGVGGFGSSGKK